MFSERSAEVKKKLNSAVGTKVTDFPKKVEKHFLHVALRFETAN